LGALIAYWAYRLAGAIAALLAVAFYSFDPNFLAHGALIKNDVPIVLLMLWLMFAIWKFGKRATLTGLVSVSLAYALAVNVKFSGLLFGWILLFALLLRIPGKMAWSWRARPVVTVRSRILLAASVCGVVALVCWGTIWLVYGFRFSLAP